MDLHIAPIRQPARRQALGLTRRARLYPKACSNVGYQPAFSNGKSSNYTVFVFPSKKGEHDPRHPVTGRRKKRKTDMGQERRSHGSKSVCVLLKS